MTDFSSGDGTSTSEEKEQEEKFEKEDRKTPNDMQKDRG